MLTGGRVVGHLRNLIDDPAATILFVGYQGEGTLGAHLQAGADDGQAGRPAPPGPLPGPLDQRLLGARRRARAARLARAASPRASDRATPAIPRRVFLVHGDPEAQVALEPKVRRPRLRDPRPALARARRAGLTSRAPKPAPGLDGRNRWDLPERIGRWDDQRSRRRPSGCECTIDYSRSASGSIVVLAACSSSGC